MKIAELKYEYKQATPYRVEVFRSQDDGFSETYPFYCPAHEIDKLSFSVDLIDDDMQKQQLIVCRSDIDIFAPSWFYFWYRISKSLKLCLHFLVALLAIWGLAKEVPFENPSIRWLAFRRTDKT